MPKAITAARAAKEIYPELNVAAFQGNVVHDLGLGAFRWADLVVGGLDNREARLAINRSCLRVGRPWIDGAIEQIQGCARVFTPESACYECTMSERDWQLLQKRRSCNLLTRSEMEQGKTPTTPTISSIIAGVQCQEALKLLHGLPTIGGRGWVFDGLSSEAYLVEYQRKDDCYSHEPIDEFVALEASVATMRVADLLTMVRSRLGADAELELTRDMLEGLACPSCGRTEPFFSSLGKIGMDRAVCPFCSGGRREAKTFYKLTGREDFSDRTFEELGVPPWDIVLARSAERVVGFEFSADRARVLAPSLARS